MEKIVFNQRELDAAASCRVIALCDNDYIITPRNDSEYIAIGNVRAVVKCSAIRAISMGMTFIGFNPEFDDCEDYEEVTVPEVKSFSSFASSFKSSFSTSFKTSFTTSYSTSFTHRHEYEYRTSFNKGSFSGSFTGGSFRMKTSFAPGSMGTMIKLRKKYVVREISVNGYGLNLI